MWVMRVTWVISIKLRPSLGRGTDSSLSKLVQLQIDKDKFSKNDTSNKKGKSGIKFWNESANETDLDSEKEGKLDKRNWERKQSST